MKTNTYELGPDDAAFIVRKDMTIEIVVPKMEEQETINYEDNQNIFLVLATAAAVEEDKFQGVISEKLDEMFEALADLSEADLVAK